MSTFIRIPENYEPLNYDLTFIPNPETFVFKGYMKLHIEVKSETTSLLLNSIELEIVEACIGNNKASTKFDEKSETVLLTFEKALTVGSHTLDVVFNGILNDRMRGFYRSFYNGKPIFTTQFEASDARRAFPCVDEPNRKATFEVNIVALNKGIIISNMPEIERKAVATPDGYPTNGEYVKVKFQKSPKMSTYLLAMSMGDFEFVEGKAENGVLVRVYTPPGKLSYADFALSIAQKALPFYESCFGQKYPLPKLDLIAIPDFACGAMENWGLVTYRETALLLKEEESSLRAKQYVALVVTHEIAHMWFGNLVTMKWWTHLWLNEGFASWMEYFCTHHVHPDYKIWTEFLLTVTTGAMSLDSMRNSHPIEIEVEGPSQVEEIFDSISYDKGACIINMLYNYIGEDKFLKGLQAYMADFAYKNAQTEDLWNAFSKSSGLNVEAIMSTWTKEMGYPVVHVSRSKTNPGEIILRQTRFLTTGDLVESEKQFWSVPVIICDGVDNAKVLAKPLMPPNGEEFVCQLAEFPSNGIRLNPGRVGYYRVNYDSSLIELLVRNVKSMTAEDRFVLLDDTFALAKAGQLEIDDLFKVLLAMKEDRTKAVWECIEDIFGYFFGIMELSTDTKLIQKWNLMVQDFAVSIFHTLGWFYTGDGRESNEDLALRPILIRLLGQSGYQPVLAEAKRLFVEFHECVVTKKQAGDEILSHDIRAAVYCTVLRHGDDTDYKHSLEMLRAFEMDIDKVRVMSVLGLVGRRNAALLESILEFSMSDEVKKQDKHTCLSSVSAGGQQGRSAIWAFIKKNLTVLPESLGTDKLVSHLISRSCSGFNTPEAYADFCSFFSTNKVPFERCIQQVTERIDFNCKCVARDREAIARNLLQLPF